MFAFDCILIYVLARARDSSVIYNVNGIQLVFFKPFLTFAKHLIVDDICDVNAPVIKDVIFILSDSGQFFSKGWYISVHVKSSLFPIRSVLKFIYHLISIQNIIYR